jgi:hypothetical protein
MKRMTPDRRLTPQEAATYNQVREQVAGEPAGSGPFS